MHTVFTSHQKLVWLLRQSLWPAQYHEEDGPVKGQTFFLQLLLPECENHSSIIPCFASSSCDSVAELSGPESVIKHTEVGGGGVWFNSTNLAPPTSFQLVQKKFRNHASGFLQPHCSGVDAQTQMSRTSFLMWPEINSEIQEYKTALDSATDTVAHVTDKVALVTKTSLVVAKL